MLKQGQIVTLFEDGKRFRGSKGLVKAVYPDTIVIECSSCWDEIPEGLEDAPNTERDFEKERRGVWSGDGNLFFYEECLEDPWKEETLEEHGYDIYSQYLTDDTTLLSFEEYHELKTEEETNEK